MRCGRRSRRRPRRRRCRPGTAGRRSRSASSRRPLALSFVRLTGRCRTWRGRSVWRRGGSCRCRGRRCRCWCRGRRCCRCCLGAARRRSCARRTCGPLALVFVRLTSRRRIRRHRRLWRGRRGGRCRRRGTCWCCGRWCSMGRRRRGRRRARRRRCCRRRRRYGLRRRRRGGRRGTRRSSGRRRGMRRSSGRRRRMRRCAFGRCALWLALRWLFGLSVGTDLTRRRLCHDDRRGLRVGRRVHEVHRRQRRSGKQHETKVCHDDVSPPERF